MILFLYLSLLANFYCLAVVAKDLIHDTDIDGSFWVSLFLTPLNLIWLASL